MRWRRIILWTLTALIVLLLVASVAGYLFLKTATFQRLALGTIIQKANQATGGRMEIGGFDFQPSTLTAHLYNITLHGTEGPSQPPLLHVDALTVGLKIESLFRREVTLSELLITHPSAYVCVDREGRNNIPNAPPEAGHNHTRIFDMAVGHVLLAGGGVTYKDTVTPLEAELYGARTEIHFDRLARQYSGVFSYSDGRLRYAGQAVMPHNLNAAFDATPSRFSLKSAVLNVGSSALSLNADVTNFSNPVVTGQYDIRIHAQDFNAMMHAARTAGDVFLSGTIGYWNLTNQPLLRRLTISGRMASEQFAVSAAQGRLDLRKLEGRYQLANGGLQIRDFGFSVLGGMVISEADINNIDATAVARVRATVRRLSLEEAQRASRDLNRQGVRVAGRLDGSAEASWSGNLSHLLARVDLNLVAPTGTQPATIVPVTGSIHASYDGASGGLALRQTTLRIPAATVSAQGQVSDHSNLLVQLRVEDLHQLATLLAGFGSGQTAAMEITGAASLQANVRGSLRRPMLEGQLSAEHLTVHSSQWKSAAFHFNANPSRLAIQNAVLMNAHQGKASFSGTSALHNWNYLSTDLITVNLSVQRLAIADLQQLANLHYPVSGDLSADLSFRGSELSPAGNGTARIDNARVYGEQFQHLATTFRADKTSISSTLDASIAAGTAKASIAYTPKTKAYAVRLNAPSLDLKKLQVVGEKNLGATGSLTIEASGDGTLDNPQLTASLSIPRLQARGKSISQLKADVRVANQRADLTVDSNIAEASVRSHATVSLSGDYYTEASIDTTVAPLNPLLAMVVSDLPQGFQGETELHATLKGPLKDKSQIEAHLTIPILKASYQFSQSQAPGNQALEIGAARPIRVDYSHSVITLQPAEIRGTDTSLRVQGNMPFGGPTTVNLSATGSIDVRIARMFAPDIQSGGTLSLDVHASGTATDPAVEGKVQLQKVSFSTPTVPLGVQDFNGTLAINNNSVQLVDVAGQVGGGRMSLGGSISYRPNLQFYLTMQSNSVRLLYPDGLRSVLDASLVLNGTKDASVVSGRVLIDGLSFTPDFDLSKFSDQFSGNSIPSQPGIEDNIKLAVDVQSKGNLSASSSQLTLEGQANLQVSGTVANPVVIGRTNLTSGEVFFRNIRYQLQRGIITFDNPNETEPVLNISATTTIEQYNLTLTMRGTLDKLMTSYTSDPPLATADVINLIAQGHTTQEQIGGGQSTDSIIASQVTGQVAGGIQHLAGLSSLQIDPLLGGNNQNPSARVALQQRVTKNFLFTFSTDLSQPGTELVQGDYQISKRWSVSLTRDELGGVSVDGKFHQKF